MVLLVVRDGESVWERFFEVLSVEDCGWVSERVECELSCLVCSQVFCPDRCDAAWECACDGEAVGFLFWEFESFRDEDA